MRVNVGDTRLFFDVEGASLVPDGPSMRQRPTVLLLHGGPGADHSTYKPLFSSLASDAQLVYLDHRGAGRSDPSHPDAWNLRTWAADVKRFCDELEIEHPIVIGWSFGGFVALRYAIDYPLHPAKLVLMATAARMSLQQIGDAMQRFGGELQRETAERFFADPSEQSLQAYREICTPLYSVQSLHSDATARIEQRPELAMHFYAGEGKSFDHRAEAARVKCPVLVISAERDPITPVEAGAEIAESLPSELAELATIENASHEVGADAPDRLMQLLRRFISS
jgi:pimeloyl-ACP methyl ester carboxylesterase